MLFLKKFLTFELHLGKISKYLGRTMFKGKYYFLMFFLDEEDLVYKDDPEDKLYKSHKNSDGLMALKGSDVHETRQTRQKKRARKDSESSNGIFFSLILP